MSKSRETAQQRRQRQLREMIDLSTKSEAVKQMIRIVCIEEGATSAHHLLDLDKRAFDLLFDGVTTLINELGVDE